VTQSTINLKYPREAHISRILFTMSLELARTFIRRALAKLTGADLIINGLTAQVTVLTAERDALIQERDKYKALYEAEKADDAATVEALTAAIAELDARGLPTLTPEEQEGVHANQPDNPQQMEEAIVEIAAEMEEVDFEAKEAPTVGTSEETPTDVVEAAAEAIAEAVVSETEEIPASSEEE